MCLVSEHVRNNFGASIFLCALAVLAALFVFQAASCCFAAVNVRLPLSLDWKDKPVSAARRLESAGFSATGENRYKGNFMDYEVSAEVSFKGRNGVLESLRITFNTNEMFTELSDALTRELGEPTQEYYPEIRQLRALQLSLNSPLWYFPKEGILVYLSNFRLSPYGWAELVYINAKAGKASIWPTIVMIIIVTAFATSSTILVRHLRQK